MTLTGTILVEFDDLAANYCTYKKLTPEIKKHMDELNKGRKEGEPLNTPCCFQVSNALNGLGQSHAVGPMSYRRKNCRLGSNYYLGAVDELERHLAGKYGRGEEIHAGPGGKRRDMRAMKEYIADRAGILAFRNTGAGAHTELWNGSSILQSSGAPANDGSIMNEAYIWSQARVVFWETVGEGFDDLVPDWLVGWWQVDDGETYYYYFSDQNYVTYVKKKPASIAMPPIKTTLNEGEVEIGEDGSTFVITWNPLDGGATVETFSPAPAGSQTTMRGTSSRFGPLTATRMG